MAKNTRQPSMSRLVAFEQLDARCLMAADFLGSDWTYEEILIVDEAFANLVDVASDNRLLRTADGGVLTFYRVGAAVDLNNNFEPIFVETDFNAINLGGQSITVADATFAFDGDGLMDDHESIRQTIYHEIAHNWHDHDD